MFSVEFDGLCLKSTEDAKNLRKNILRLKSHIELLELQLEHIQGLFEE